MILFSAHYFITGTGLWNFKDLFVAVIITVDYTNEFVFYMYFLIKIFF